MPSRRLHVTSALGGVSTSGSEMFVSKPGQVVMVLRLTREPRRSRSPSTRGQLDRPEAIWPPSVMVNDGLL